MNPNAFIFFVMTLIALPVNAEDGVVLLHGLCRSAASMNQMEKFIRSSGYVVLNVDYKTRESSIAEIADQVIPEALGNPIFKDCKRIHFVTHSLGGIIVRSYFSRNPSDKLGRVVMLAPPNQGSEVVDRLKGWSLFKLVNGPAGTELGTDATATPVALGPVTFEVGVIAGDRSINWINSSMIKGSDDGKVSTERSKVSGMKDYRVVHVSHPYIMKNKAVMQATLNFLENGDFGALKK
ncbi:MAG: alpha/beta hydrolase [Verrucomicrobiota bacterium]